MVQPRVFRVFIKAVQGRSSTPKATRPLRSATFRGFYRVKTRYGAARHGIRVDPDLPHAVLPLGLLPHSCKLLHRAIKILGALNEAGHSTFLASSGLPRDPV